MYKVYLYDLPNSSEPAVYVRIKKRRFGLKAFFCGNVFVRTLDGHDLGWVKEYKLEEVEYDVHEEDVK